MTSQLAKSPIVLKRCEIDPYLLGHTNKELDPKDSESGTTFDLNDLEEVK